MSRSRLVESVLAGLLLTGSALSASACRDTRPKDAAALAAQTRADSARLVGSAAEVDVPKMLQRCALCHQANGSGTTNIFPPLAGVDYVTGSADRLIVLMLRGVSGAITVKGVLYTNQMMAYGDGNELTDFQLAALLTSIRMSWGNVASAITAADVARVRAATVAHPLPYTAAELDAFR